MSAISNDLDAWLLDAPVVEIAAGGDFDFWDLDAPVITQDTSNPNLQTRRRPWEF